VYGSGAWTARPPHPARRRDRERAEEGERAGGGEDGGSCGPGLNCHQLLRQPPRSTRPREADVSPEQDAVCQVKRLLPREPAGRLLSSVVRLLLKHCRSKGTQKMKITSFAAARDTDLKTVVNAAMEEARNVPKL
jgi:hypothetical protein